MVHKKNTKKNALALIFCNFEYIIAIIVNFKTFKISPTFNCHLVFKDQASWYKKPEYIMQASFENKPKRLSLQN